VWHKIVHIGITYLALWLLVAATPLPASPLPAPPHVSAHPTRPLHLPEPSPLSERLASPLYRLYHLYRYGGGEDAEDDAAALMADDTLPPDAVRVVAHLDDTRPHPLSMAVETGLDIETTAAGGRVLQGVIPIAQLEALALAPGVRLVRLPLEPVVSGFVSEGMRMSSVEAWHDRGWRGAGQSVAVIDLGFAGYSTLLGDDLPADTVAHSLRGDGDIEAGTAHGTACAEIVHDMAPEADLILINLATDVEFAAAMDYLRAEGVDIVSSALGWPLGGPGDGTGPIAQAVRGVLDDGVLWVNAAGNMARRHWMGSWQDAEGDGLLDFVPGVSINTIEVAPGQIVRLALRWDDDWSFAVHDFVLELYDDNLSLVDYAATPATGPGDPTRYLAVNGLPAGRYHVMVRRLDMVPGDPALQLYAYDQDLERAVPEGSILVPADMADVVAVGAVPSDMPILTEGFSSRGPSTDGRIKPDLVAPDRVSCASYDVYRSGEGGGLWGTSAAAAHVVGAAAVLKEFYTGYHNELMADLLRAHTVDLGAEGPDNTYGHGRLLLDNVPEEQPTAAPTWTPSVTPTPTNTLTPSITPTASDTPTASSTPSVTTTPTETSTPTATASPTPTETATPTLTPTPGPSLTPTAAPTPTPFARTWAPVVLRELAPPAVIVCEQGIINGGFETNDGWVRSITAHRADYSTSVVHGGARSMRLGIEPPASNRMTWSSAYQLIEVPADATSATLTLWRWRRTEEPPLGSMGTEQRLLGNAALLSQLASGGDLHEILLLDAMDAGTVVAVLEQGRWNDGYWQPAAYNLMPWRGRRLRLYFNAYNDGLAGRSWMYVDDVSLQICVAQ
jgi:hypothetical protein